MNCLGMRVKLNEKRIMKNWISQERRRD